MVITRMSVLYLIIVNFVINQNVMYVLKITTILKHRKCVLNVISQILLACLNVKWQTKLYNFDKMKQ